nr:reverse transcriptase domain-containing protein [Tanacetum cinerariifolium]
APKCGKCKRYGHTTTDCRVNTNNNNNNSNNKNQKAGACYECGNTGHIKKNCPKLKNHRNGSGNGVAQGRVYALGGRDAIPDSNVIIGTFLLNNCYAKILFDTGADMSFVSTTFSALIDITPTTLENHSDVELADGKIIGVNTIIRGCTLNFMNHPFNIDLMPVPLGSFDVIIGMDWLTKYHGVIICDEKIVRVPFEREIKRTRLIKMFDTPTVDDKEKSVVGGFEDCLMKGLFKQVADPDNSVRSFENIKPDIKDASIRVQSKREPSIAWYLKSLFKVRGSALNTYANILSQIQVLSADTLFIMDEEKNPMEIVYFSCTNNVNIPRLFLESLAPRLKIDEPVIDPW